MDTEVGKCWEIAKNDRILYILCITVMRIEMHLHSHRGTGNN